MSTEDIHHAEPAEDHVESGWAIPDYAPLTVPTLLGQLQHRAARYRDKVAFAYSRDGEEKQVSRLSYEELDAHARRIASSINEPL